VEASVERAPGERETTKRSGKVLLILLRRRPTTRRWAEAPEGKDKGGGKNVCTLSWIDAAFPQRERRVRYCPKGTGQTP